MMRLLLCLLWDRLFIIIMSSTGMSLLSPRCTFSIRLIYW